MLALTYSRSSFCCVSLSLSLCRPATSKSRGDSMHMQTLLLLFCDSTHAHAHAHRDEEGVHDEPQHLPSTELIASLMMLTGYISPAKRCIAERGVPRGGKQGGWHRRQLAMAKCVRVHMGSLVTGTYRPARGSGSSPGQCSRRGSRRSHSCTTCTWSRRPLSRASLLPPCSSYHGPGSTCRHSPRVPHCTRYSRPR